MTGQGASKAVLGHDPMPGQIAFYIMRADIGWRRPLQSWLLVSILWPASQKTDLVKMGIMAARGMCIDIACSHVNLSPRLFAVPLSNTSPLCSKRMGAAWCRQ